MRSEDCRSVRQIHPFLSPFYFHPFLSILAFNTDEVAFLPYRSLQVFTFLAKMVGLRLKKGTLRMQDRRKKKAYQLTLVSQRACVPVGNLFFAHRKR